jgi:hypothetical protein
LLVTLTQETKTRESRLAFQDSKIAVRLCLGCGSDLSRIEVFAWPNVF